MDTYYNLYNITYIDVECGDTINVYTERNCEYQMGLDYFGSNILMLLCINKEIL